MIGMDIEVPSLTSNKVNRSRPLNYNISSDIISSDYINFIFFAVNMFTSLLINAICHQLNHRNNVRKLLLQDKSEVITGQVIAVLIPIVLPWTFCIFGSYFTFSTKVNLVFQYILFLVSIIFQAYYLLVLMEKNR